jgi:glyoxylase-like metal-dependent hydrolase (beta-lactamase superfamily II)
MGGCAMLACRTSLRTKWFQEETMNNLSRRALLGSAAAAAALPLLPAAQAAAPFRNDMAPGWHRTKLGGYELTIITDGALPLGAPEPAFPASPPNEIRELLTRNFLQPDAATLEQNALVLNTGRQLILFDTGMGDSMGEASKMFGPTTGRLLANMRAAGIDPAQIDVVALTHAHCDHCWALVDADGKKNFPNAQVAISEVDLKFWTDDSNKKGPAFMVPFIDGAKKNLAAYSDRMIMAKDGQEVVPGVTAFATPGHTLGHMVYFITDGNNVLVNAGDLAHHQILLLRKPLWEFAYDTDPKLAAQSRLRMLTRLAEDKHRVMSYHFPWPGLGHVAREGEGFGWYPEATNVTTL